MTRPKKLVIKLFLLIATSLSAYARDCSDDCSVSNSCDISCCQTICLQEDIPLTSNLLLRSAGSNTARQLVGWQWDINLPYMCENYGAAYLAFEYTRTFKNDKLAKALFGSTRLDFAGSLVPDRNPRALLAENFGLARDFVGNLCFKPTIENFILELGLYVGLDCWMQGLYFKLYAPLVHTRWDLGLGCNPCDVCPTTTIRPYNACFAGNASTACINTPDSIAVAGCTTPAPGIIPPTTITSPNTFSTLVTPSKTASTLQQALSGTFLFGDMLTPWCAGRFDFGRRTRTGFADIDLILGYNFLNTDNYYLGLYGQAVLPAGGKIRDTYIFNPVVGNGGFFELGGGLDAYLLLWDSECSQWGVFLEGYVTHMFKNRQCRLFDFCSNGPFSRYMLLKEFDTSGPVPLYTGKLISATCFNNRNIDVNVNIKGDASIKFSYRSFGFSCDLGYNVYGHSGEKISLHCSKNICPVNRQYGIKGTEPTCCFSYPIVNVTSGATVTPTVFPAGAILADLTTSETFSEPTGCMPLDIADPLPVSIMANTSTQPKATAYSGSLCADCPVLPNPGTCSVCLDPASAQVLVPTGIPVSSLTPDNGFLLAHNRIPAFVNPDNINIDSARSPGLLTHKLFTHIDYVWTEHCWTPAVGIGAEVEFSAVNKHKHCTPRFAFFQWGIWLKSHVSF